MSPHMRRSRSSPVTAVLAVILLFAGLSTIVLSLWMQEQQIKLGAEEYDALSQQLKQPTVTDISPNEPSTAETAEPMSTDFASQSDQPIVIAPAVMLVPSPPVSTDGPAVQDEYEHDQPAISEPFVGGRSGYTGADLAACKATNSDFIGWLQIPGTKVDYPVVLTNDVDYYLGHTFNHQENIIGCLFSLGKSDYSAPSRNIAVYGHHMRRSRATTMFQPLHEYKSASIRNAHADISFDTLYGSRSYTVFAVINKRESDWDASAADFASEADYQAFLDRALEWSLYDTGVQVSADDHILTLITCDRDYHSDDGQLVVMAVQN